jgi:hemolysin activation/secretion protein
LNDQAETGARATGLANRTRPGEYHERVNVPSAVLLLHPQIQHIVTAVRRLSAAALSCTPVEAITATVAEICANWIEFRHCAKRNSISRDVLSLHPKTRIFETYPGIHPIMRSPTRVSRTQQFALVASAVMTLATAMQAATAQSLPPPTPDPSVELRRQDERTQAQRQREEKSVDVKSPAVELGTARLPSTESPCFKIDHLELVFTGNALASAEPQAPSGAGPSFYWLLGAVAGPNRDDSPKGKCLGAKGVELVLKRAQENVVQRGYVTTRVLAQKQDLSSGTLSLTVIPGRVRDMRFKLQEGDAGKDAVAPRVSLANTVPIQRGDVLNLRDVEQALENFKRVPTVDADIQIEPAQAAGAADQSDLVISYQQRAPARLSFTADDSGSKSTGKYQGSATVSLDNPLGLSDLFYLTWNHDLGGGEEGARGTRGYTTHYSLPLDYWMWGATYTSGRYFQTVAGLAQDYVYSGASENLELKASKLVYRDAVRKTTLALSGWQRRSNNFIDDTEVLVQRRVEGGWTLSVNHKDAVGDLAFEGGFAYKRGTGDFDAIPAPEEAFNEGTAKLGLLTLDLSATVPYKAFNSNFKYAVAVHVQDNTTPLTPQDRLAIGGRYSVRGFDGDSSLVGERGWTLHNDWSVALGSSGQELYLGMDAGEVSGPSTQSLLGKTLSGAVLGLRGSYKKLQYDLFVGAPLYQPTGFKTAKTSAGFSVSLNL